jgi:hypothetical protein
MGIGPILLLATLAQAPTAGTNAQDRAKAQALLGEGRSGDSPMLENIDVVAGGEARAELRPLHGPLGAEAPRIDLAGQRTAEPASSGWWLGRKWTGIAAGSTAVLAGAAAIVGYSMQSRFDDLKNRCGRASVERLGCEDSDIDSVHTRMVTANVLWGLAGAAADLPGAEYLAPVSVEPDAEMAIDDAGMADALDRSDAVDGADDVRPDVIRTDADVDASVPERDTAASPSADSATDRQADTHASIDSADGPSSAPDARDAGGGDAAVDVQQGESGGLDSEGTQADRPSRSQARPAGGQVVVARPDGSPRLTVMPKSCDVPAALPHSIKEIDE